MRNLGTTHGPDVRDKENVREMRESNFREMMQMVEHISATMTSVDILEINRWGLLYVIVTIHKLCIQPL